MLENIIWLIISAVCVSDLRDSQSQDHFTACEISPFFWKKKCRALQALKVVSFIQ